MRSFLLAVAVLLALAPECHARDRSYAPPVRIPGYGMPGRIQAGQMEVGGAVVSYLLIGITGGPVLALAVNEWLQVEVAGEFHTIKLEPLFYWAEPWYLGSAGVRFTPVKLPRGSDFRAVFDFELGLGAGTGGHRCSTSDEYSCNIDYPEDWYEIGRFAGGGYVGVGTGLTIRFFSVFMRCRFQITGATHVPATFWAGATTGFGFSVARIFHVHLAGGFIYSKNRFATSGVGPLIQLGMSFSFPVLPARASQ